MNSDGSDKYKVRYVAKSYSQKKDLNYGETLSPTASMMNIKVLMQMMTQEDIFVHHMVVKTAFLHAPIECELYIDEPEGYLMKSQRNKTRV